MGLRIDVFRAADKTDCTNYGISSQFTSLTLVNVDGPFEPQEEGPYASGAAMLVDGNAKDTVRIVPAVRVSGGWIIAPGWFMMGGNYGATSDSRFRAACEALLGFRFYGAVSIHDRIEL